MAFFLLIASLLATVASLLATVAAPVAALLLGKVPASFPSLLVQKVPSLALAVPFGDPRRRWLWWSSLALLLVLLGLALLVSLVPELIDEVVQERHCEGMRLVEWISGQHGETKSLKSAVGGESLSRKIARVGVWRARQMTEVFAPI
jgi:hypothetical protein